MKLKYGMPYNTVKKVPLPTLLGFNVCKILELYKNKLKIEKKHNKYSFADQVKGCHSELADKASTIFLPSWLEKFRVFLLKIKP